MHVRRKLPWQYPVFETVRPPNPEQVGEKGVLIFSKTNGFRHQSIEVGIEALQKAGKERGWDVRATENGAFFNEDYLSRFKVIVFLSTTGAVLTAEQKKAFEKFSENGGSFAGIHSASDTEYDWIWYGQYLGTRFRDHTILPWLTPEAELITEIKDHPATKHLPATWTKVDEWYNFTSSVRGKQGFQVLLSVNNSSYTALYPRAMHPDHPISWINQVGNSRMFYTGLGHTAGTFNDIHAMPHIIEGMSWAGRLE